MFSDYFSVSYDCDVTKATLRATLESVQKSDESDNQTIQCGDESGKM